jgi:hypothetical protein
MAGGKNEAWNRCAAGSPGASSAISSKGYEIGGYGIGTPSCAYGFQYRSSPSRTPERAWRSSGRSLVDRSRK